jgi:hypothetical protein
MEDGFIRRVEAVESGKWKVESKGSRLEVLSLVVSCHFELFTFHLSPLGLT